MTFANCGFALLLSPSWSQYLQGTTVSSGLWWSSWVYEVTI